MKMELKNTGVRNFMLAAAISMGSIAAYQGTINYFQRKNADFDPETSTQIHQVGKRTQLSEALKCSLPKLSPGSMDSAGWAPYEPVVGTEELTEYVTKAAAANSKLFSPKDIASLASGAYGKKILAEMSEEYALPSNMEQLVRDGRREEIIDSIVKNSEDSLEMREKLQPLSDFELCGKAKSILAEKVKNEALGLFKKAPNGAN